MGTYNCSFKGWTDDRQKDRLTDGDRSTDRRCKRRKRGSFSKEKKNRNCGAASVGILQDILVFNN